MDPDGEKQIKKFDRKRKETSFLKRYVSNVGNDLSPIWVRRLIQTNHGLEWFLLGCRYRFLFNFRLFLVIFYITYQALK
jgi:hypothetical protein